MKTPNEELKAATDQFMLEVQRLRGMAVLEVQRLRGMAGAGVLIGADEHGIGAVGIPLMKIALNLAARSCRLSGCDLEFLQAQARDSFHGVQ